MRRYGPEDPIVDYNYFGRPITRSERALENRVGKVSLAVFLVVFLVVSFFVVASVVQDNLNPTPDPYEQQRSLQEFRESPEGIRWHEKQREYEVMREENRKIREAKKGKAPEAR